MDKKIAGLLGAVAAVTTMTGAQAATQSPAATLQASSYADLLIPVPNATAALIADNEVLAQAPAKRSDGVQGRRTSITTIIITSLSSSGTTGTITTTIIITTAVFILARRVRAWWSARRCVDCNGLARFEIAQAIRSGQGFIF